MNFEYTITEATGVSADFAATIEDILNGRGGFVCQQDFEDKVRATRTDPGDGGIHIYDAAGDLEGYAELTLDRIIEDDRYGTIAYISVVLSESD